MSHVLISKDKKEEALGCKKLKILNRDNLEGQKKECDNILKGRGSSHSTWTYIKQRVGKRS